MKTKQINTAILFLGMCFLSFTAISQEQLGEKRAQIEELRQNYINERLGLTAAEQKAFEELRKEYKEKIKALRANYEGAARNMRKEMVERPKEDRELSEEQAREILMARIEREEAKTKLDKEYTEALIKAISAKKTIDYKRLEREFKRELIHMVKDDRERHRMNQELRQKRPEEAESRPGEAK